MSQLFDDNLNAITSPRHRRGSMLLKLFLMMVMCFGVAEIAARLLTGVAKNGMPAIGPVPLLPYLPYPDQVRADWIQSNESSYMVPDAELGWTLAPHADAFDGMYTTNAQSIRTDPQRIYTHAIPKKTSRIVVVGNSFTHGDEVMREDTWPYYLEQNMTGTEVLNFGVPGYGTDQALLRWRRDARKFSTNIVILGIWPENICRNLNRLRYYLQPAGHFISKPRFVMDGETLRYLPQPVTTSEQLTSLMCPIDSATVVDNEYWISTNNLQFPWYYHLRSVRALCSVYEMFDRTQRRKRLYAGIDSAGIEITVGIARQFSREVIESGAQPIILLLPMRDLLMEYPNDGDLPLAKALVQAELEVVDLNSVFSAAYMHDEPQQCFLPSGHLTPRGNRLLADHLSQYLSTQTFGAITND